MNLWVEHARSAASGLWVWRWPVHSEGQQQKTEKTTGRQAGPQPAAPADARFRKMSNKVKRRIRAANGTL
ncbi:MAG TPA: hypothetical protein DCY59_07640 [Micrococcaceae bacterium]|nr:hypothetical protein [Micrococcaceae bacterium]